VLTGLSTRKKAARSGQMLVRKLPNQIMTLRRSMTMTTPKITLTMVRATILMIQVAEVEEMTQGEVRYFISFQSPAQSISADYD
jgi:hypothetical protein